MHKPISKYFEQEFFRYYGWPAYWNEGGAAMGVTTLFLPPREAELHAWAEQKIHQDPHLRSTAGLTDYAIQALDGEVGSVSGFLIEERDWRIHEILAECGHWYACKEVMIPTERVERISYEDCKIFVSLTKKEILDTAAHHIVKPTQPTHYQKHKFQSNILTTADTMYVASTSEWNYLL